MATDTRQRLIDVARHLFYQDGFRNVGVDAILAEVGISKTAFYKHFASKDDLMIAVLEATTVLVQHQFRDMVRDLGGPSAVGQLRAIVDVVERIMNEGDFHGCIFINASIEFPLPHDPVHQVAAQHKRSVEDFFYELAERAHVEDPQAFAEELFLAIAGAYVNRSLTNDPSTIHIARRVIDHLIDREVPIEIASR